MAQKIEDILAIPPQDWTPEQEKRVRDAIASGEFVVMKAKPHKPMATPPPYWSLMSRPFNECAIAAYFRDNPTKSYVHMTCTCRFCTPIC